MSNNATVGTLYDLNKNLYKQVPHMNSNDFDNMATNMALWFSSRAQRKYFMFLCRELNDYTIFHFNSANYNAAREELVDLIRSRGNACIDIQYDHAGDNYDIWLKRYDVETKEAQVYMYKLFPCDDFIIEI